jgi:hypothetical protein
LPARDPRGSRRLILRRRCPPPCARRTNVYISGPYYIVNYQTGVSCDLSTLWAPASNSAANSAVGPVSAPRIPLPAASLNCRQQSDLSMIYNLRGRFSGRSEVFLPASREVWSTLQEELIGE